MKTCYSLTIAVLTLSSVLSAGPRAKMVPGHQPAKRLSVEKILDLTAEQRDAIQRIRIDFLKKQIPRHADLKLARIELEELIESEAPVKKIDEQIRKIAEIQTQLLDYRIKERLEVGKILTKEQKRQLRHHCPRPGRPSMGWHPEDECMGDLGLVFPFGPDEPGQEGIDE